MAGAYALGMYAASVAITGAAGGWLPDQVLLPGLGLALGVVVIAALSLLGSVFLSVTANGIAAFMLLGAGLTAGLLGEIGEAVGSESLQTAARAAAWAVPFEALYQASLHALTSESSGLTGVVLRLGPFGGAQGAGPQLWLWAMRLHRPGAVAGLRRVRPARPVMGRPDVSASAHTRRRPQSASFDRPANMTAGRG